MCKIPDDLPKWSDMFPDGRFIFFEGRDHHAFAEEMVERFAFDPRYQESYCEARGWGFHCPVEALDEVYGSGRYPMGS